MTGLELLKAPNTTAGEIADIVSEHCPPVVPANCDCLSCRECWLAWLTTGNPPKEKGPSDERTTPREEDNTPYYPGKPGPSPYISEKFRHHKPE